LKITFCIYNEKRKDVILLLKSKYPKLEISTAKCIYCCGECAEKPIARIKDQLFVADNAEKLVYEINKFIEKH
jgi:uncharacterized protein YuzB (UPF0349 family)